MTALKGKKIALVFDWLDDIGGMEQVNLALAELFPEAVIFTSVYEPRKFPELSNREVRTSFLQELPQRLRPKHQFLAPFMPWAFWQFDMSEFDVIISSASSGFSKCVKKNPRKKQIHVCYCHTPIRYLYNAREEYLENYELPWWAKPFRFVLPLLLDWFTSVDQAAAKKVDYFIGNSKYVAARIEKYYRKKAEVVYPGILDNIFGQDQKNSSSRGSYYLGLGRFIPYKRFDLLVEAFAKNGLPLKLAGTGPELERCKKTAEKLKAKNIEFLGFVPSEKLASVYGGAKAFLFPAEEDFGLAPVEAMQAGLPVIYYNKGGACESVGKWGLAFEDQTAESLNKVVTKFEKKSADFSAAKIKKRAEVFSAQNFQQNFLAFVQKHC